MDNSGAPPTASLDDPGSWGEEHERVVRWRDPAPSIGLSATMSGIDYLRALAEGRLPSVPISETMGMTVTRVGEGEVEFRCTPDGSLLNPLGLVHGGLHATLLDSVMGCALHTLLPAATGYTTIEMKVSFMKAVAPGDELIATGRVTKSGRRVAFSEGTIANAAGALVATASESMLIMGG